jgi:hypothetical protein
MTLFRKTTRLNVNCKSDIYSSCYTHCFKNNSYYLYIYDIFHLFNVMFTNKHQIQYVVIKNNYFFCGFGKEVIKIRPYGRNTTLVSFEEHFR